MATQIDFVVVGHHSRRDQAESLADRLNATLFIDDAFRGSNWNHLRALQWANEQPNRVVILEDDAIPVDAFESQVVDWLERFPKQVVSFYLGTGRPPQRQLEIAMRLIDADKHRSDFIMLKRLVHGVCYSIPPQHIQRILSVWNPQKGADYAISDGYPGTVIYPVFSLVDHADEDIVEVHPDKRVRVERRKAWRLYKETV